MSKTIGGIVTWLRSWFYTKSEVDSLISTGGGLEDNTFTNFWNDGDTGMFVNKAIGIGYLHFNKNMTIGANSSTIIHPVFDSTDERIQYCPNVGTYLPTSVKDVFILVNYQGRITVFNRSSSAISNANVQGLMMWRAKGYPK
jgi:hypothetical protein